MRVKLIQKMIILSMVTILTFGLSVSAAESNNFVESDTVDSKGNEYDYALSSVMMYETEDSTQYDFGFSKTIEKDGLTYNLDNVEYTSVNLYEREYGEETIEYSVTVEETVLGKDKDVFKPTKNITKDGHDYEYDSISYEEISSEIIQLYKYLDTELLQDGLVVENFPNTMPYEHEGIMYDLEYSDYEVLSDGWHDGYYLYGTISDYDAVTYQVGNVVIENKGDTFDLDPRCYVEFLEGLDIPSDKYKINSVSYNGEPYTNDAGIVCRDFVVSAQMNGTRYRLNYRYDLENSEYKAIITYKLSESEVTAIDKLKNSYEVTATAYYSIKKEIKKEELSVPVKVAIALGVILCIGALITLIVYLVRGGRRKTEDMNKRELKDEFNNL